MDLLKRDAQLISRRFGLEYKVIEPERANVKSRYGICYDDGTIRIRLNHAVSGQPLKYSSLVSTLCHELAHLRHFNHGPKFRAFNQELLAWARQQGIYLPGSAPTLAGTSPSVELIREPVQPDLRELVRSGRMPTLRDSLAGVLPPRHGASVGAHVTGAAVTDAPVRESTPRQHTTPSQLELFAVNEAGATQG